MDKLIVSNRSALITKYTASGLATIENAIARLTAADRQRGIKTGHIYIDDSADMARVGGVAVAGPQDEVGAKKAVDAIATTHESDYLVILDGPDVVPHISLDNPLPQDGDPDVPSDLPYASPAAYSRNINDFLAATRVVSRIPAPTGGGNANFLAELLDRARVHTVRSADDYKSYFAISADAWATSTQMSLNQAFGNFTTLRLAPPDAHSAINPDLANLAHFINCHGQSLQPKFYGEKAGQFPVSIESAKLVGNIKKDTIVAAECCFGAQLYDHTLAGRDQPICLTYFEHGAIGFVGSTNIAYGPATANGAADLMAQFFWIELLKGLSLGRAFLQARQSFVQRERMSDPANLKTIGQFVLLGDAALHPCSPPSDEELDSAIDVASQRKAVRLALASNGKSVTASASTMAEPVRADNGVAGHAGLLARVSNLARAHGLERADVTTYRVSGGEEFLNSVKAMKATPLVTVAVDVKKNENIPEVRILVAHSLQQDGEHAISSIRSYVSR